MSLKNPKTFKKTLTLIWVNFLGAFSEIMGGAQSYSSLPPYLKLVRIMLET